MKNTVKTIYKCSKCGKRMKVRDSKVYRKRQRDNLGKTVNKDSKQEAQSRVICYLCEKCRRSVSIREEFKTVLI